MWQIIAQSKRNVKKYEKSHITSIYGMVKVAILMDNLDDLFDDDAELHKIKSKLFKKLDQL